MTQCKLWGICSSWQQKLDRLKWVMILVGLVLFQDQFQSRDLQADIWDYELILHSKKSNADNGRIVMLDSTQVLGFVLVSKLSNSLALSECVAMDRTSVHRTKILLWTFAFWYSVDLKWKVFMLWTSYSGMEAFTETVFSVQNKMPPF